MATVMNDRDVLLLGTAQRSTNPQGATILITADNPAFHVNSSNVTTPSYITFTAHLLGITGTASFTASGATITDNHDNTATIAYNGMSGASATVTATATVNGQTYSASTSVAKITDGTAGGTGPAGDQHAIAYLYQWNVTTPAKPTGTTVYTWANSTNSTYTDSDNWSVTVPSNPGTPGLSLYVAAMPISASGGTTTTSVSYTSSTVQAWTTNGAQGPQGNAGTAGMQSATINVYQWAASIPAGPSGTSTYTWNGGAIGTIPTEWTATPGTAASQGMTLWAARIYLTDSATNSQTSFNWTSAAVVAVGYSGNNGAAGTAGASSVTAYCASTTTTTTTTPAQTTGKTSVPATNDGGITGTWQSTVPALSSGQYLYQSDGIYDPTTNKVTWSIPYWSSLKVGSLSAITTNTGTLNVSGPISSANGKFSVDANGNVIMQSASMQDGSGNVILQVGTPLADAYVPVSAQNSQLTPIINNAATTAQWSGVSGANKPEDNANFTSASRGAAMNDDPCVENANAWGVSQGISIGTNATSLGGGAVCPHYLYASSGADLWAHSTRRFTIDPGKTYSLTAMLFAATGNDRNMYLYVNFYDASGNLLHAGQWGGTMSGYTFGGLPPAGSWTRQGTYFGSGTGYAIPTGTVTAEVGVWFQYSGGGTSAVTQAAQDVRLEECTTAYANLVSLNNIASDNVLSKGEKPVANQAWTVIYNEQSGLQNQASSLGVDSTDYTNKFNTLQSYLVGLGSGFTDYTTDTSIDGTTFHNNFSNYYQAKQALINAMAAKASTLATYTGVSNRPQDTTNLVNKPSFEDGSVGYWDGGPVVAVTGQAFSKALQFSARDNIEHAGPFPVNVGETLYAEAWLDASTTTYTVNFGIYFVKADGSYVTWTPIVARTAGAGWAFGSGSCTVPAGSVSAYPWLQINGSSSLGTARAALMRISRHQNGATVGANASNLSVTVGGDNLVNNSSFEYQDSTTNRPLGYQAYNNAGVASSYVVRSGRLGGKCFALRADATGATNWGLYTGDSISDSGGVTGGVQGGWQPNKTYTIAFKARKVNGANFNGIALRWNTQPASTVAVLSPALSADWQTYVFRITWGSTWEGGGHLYVDCNNGSVAVNDEFHVDELIIQEGDVYSEWFLSSREASAMATGVTLSSNGTLNGAGGGQVTLPGMGHNTFRAITQGNSCTATLPANVGFYINGALQSGSGIARSYNVIVLNRSNGSVVSYTNYDVYGVGQTNGKTAATMASDLNALGPDKLVVVVSFDEPQAHRLDSGLDTAMYRCGASRAVYGSSQFKVRCAYILVGIPGCGEGNGAEAYQGAVDNDPNAWVDVSFGLVNGILSGVSTNYKPRTLTDYGYIGDLNATNGATLGVNVSGTVTNAKDISQNLGTFVSAGTARTQISDTGIRVYDSSNTLRIKIGQL